MRCTDPDCPDAGAGETRMRLTLYRPFVLSSAATMESVKMPAGEYEAVTAPNPWRNDVLWMVLVDTDIGASFQWMRVFSREHPEVLHLQET